MYPRDGSVFCFDFVEIAFEWSSSRMTTTLRGRRLMGRKKAQMEKGRWLDERIPSKGVGSSCCSERKSLP